MNYPNMTLWSDASFFSPYAMSVYVALTEKGIPFTLKRVDLSRNAQWDDSYRALSLTCRVPTLQIDDLTLNESSAIAEYLEERFPAPEYERLYPRDREKRAHAREIQAWLRSDFMALRQERLGIDAARVADHRDEQVHAHRHAADRDPLLAEVDL